jgi:hypothetical protein
MSDIRTAGGVDGSLRSGGGRAARYLSSGLRFAATPTFAVMALLAGLPGDGGPAEILCLTADHASPFGGMVPMYLLMSLFHLTPWLRLIARRSGGADRA